MSGNCHPLWRSSLNSRDWGTVGYATKMNIHTGEKVRQCVICGCYYDPKYSYCTCCFAYKILYLAGRAIFLGILVLIGWLYS